MHFQYSGDILCTFSLSIQCDFVLMDLVLSPSCTSFTLVLLPFCDYCTSCAFALLWLLSSSVLCYCPLVPLAPLVLLPSCTFCAIALLRKRAIAQEAHEAIAQEARELQEPEEWQDSCHSSVCLCVPLAARGTQEGNRHKRLQEEQAPQEGNIAQEGKHKRCKSQKRDIAQECNSHMHKSMTFTVQ